MANSVRRVCVLLAISAIFGGLLQLPAQESKTQKTWSFQGKAGTTEIMLIRYVLSDGTARTSLGLGSPDGSPRDVAEEAVFLGRVLDELPKTGVSIQSLGWISFRFNEPDVVKVVAERAASSNGWRKAVATKKISVVYPLVTSFLNASEAYEEWVRVFNQRGLTLRIVGVEEVMMEPFSKSGAKCPANANCDHLIVPCDALVQMNVGRLDQQ